MNINYGFISKAIEFYVSQGYKYIEVPWIVSKKSIDVTLPEGKRAFHDGRNYLVGSAEQSFIQLMIDDKLDKGKYVAVSPCFRDDDVDDLHQKYFMKVELIKIIDNSYTSNRHLLDVISSALDFFYTISTELVETTGSFDIELNGIEIGSYGYRSYKDKHWIYGTGLAEPRFSTALLMNNK